MKKQVIIAGIVIGTLMLNTTITAQASKVVTTDYSWQDISRYQMQCADEYQDLMAELNGCDDLEEWYDRYTALISQYSNICDRPESIYDYFSAEDVEYLLRMCETECRGQDFESKVHVCEVALNRVESDKFPNSPKEVVTSRAQFSYKLKSSDVTDETRKALECAFQIPDLTHGSLYFHSIKECDYFYGREFVFIDKAGHKFYI